MSMLAILLLLAVAVVAAVLALRRGSAPSAAAAPALTNAADAADAKPASPLTFDDIVGFERWYAKQALPAIDLHPAPGQAIAAGGTRLGGPAWLADGEAWPIDPATGPLEFVAQVDFADLPSLPGFPASGLLQFFLPCDDLMGLDFDDPTRGGFKCLWRERLDGGALHAPSPPDERLYLWQDDATRATGVALTGSSAQRLPDAADWRVEQRLAGWHDRDGFEGIDDILERAFEAQPMAHHVGGHPAFTQSDFRRAGHLDDYDRVLLRLTSDDHIMWGDVSEAVFMIRAADLAARDFSRVAFNWDCH